MSAPDVPLVVDAPRSAAETVARLERLLGAAGPEAAAERPLQTALLQIAARHAEVLTACLNAAPALHLQAFDAFLTGRGRPATPARATLVFEAAPGTAPVVVPMHTQVAAQPADGDAGPVVFETEDDLELVRAEPRRACLVDAGHRRQADLAPLLAPAGRDAAADPFARALPVPQAWHLGHRAAFGAPGLSELRLQLGFDAGSRPANALPLQAGIATPEGFRPLALRSDTTAACTRDGELVFDAPPAAWPTTQVAGIESCWLTLRPAAAGAVGVPRVRAATLRIAAATGPAPATAACFNHAPLDLGKDAYPLGERPRFGDVFELLSPAFERPGAHVELRIGMTNPDGAPDDPLPAVDREAGRPRIAWELSTAAGFRALSAADGTRALTADGALTFTVPPDVAPTTIAGRTGVWLRGRLVSGHYGSTPATPGMPLPQPRAPSIRTLTVASTLALGPLAPEHSVRDGSLGRVVQPAGGAAPFDLFVAPEVGGAALYLGFAAGPGAFAAGRTLNLQVRAAPLRNLPDAPAAPRWQQRAAEGWRDVALRHDGSAGLTRGGIVRLRLAADAAPWTGSALDPTAELAWLRLLWPDAPDPLPLGLALNAVPAVQWQRLPPEPLGASNGRGGQTFRALRTPIVGELRLQVREAGADWVAWQEVDDFGESRADSRHYTLNRGRGTIVFGDGRHGRIPPAGPNNLRLQSYAVGGGQVGNRAAGTITLLRSALPAVAAVTNLEAAAGGLDAESAAERQAHASAWLRHRDRAVGADDHADLALTASPEVARAWCLAGRDLARDEAAGAAGTAPAADREPGVVSLIVMPASADPRPQPGPALRELVEAHLAARRAPVGRLVVVGPTYAAASVTLRYTPAPGASAHAVDAEIADRLARFLHPLTGGTDGRGWAPTRRPHRSDLVALAAAVPGVDVVRSARLQIEAVAHPAPVVAAGRIDVAASER